MPSSLNEDNRWGVASVQSVTAIPNRTCPIDKRHAIKVIYVLDKNTLLRNFKR